MQSLCAVLNFRNFLILMCCQWHKRNFHWETSVVFEVTTLMLLESLHSKANRNDSLCPEDFLWLSLPPKHFIAWLDCIEFPCLDLHP